MNAPAGFSASQAFGRMSRRDRDWILKRLSPEERERLLELMDRQAGGLETRASVESGSAPGDFASTLEQESLRHAAEPQAPQARSAAGSDAVMATLGAANPGHLLQVLRGEGDFVVAALLYARPWQWRGMLLERLGAEQRARLLRLAPSAREARPAVVAALVEAVAARLAELRSAGVGHASDPAAPAPARQRKIFGLGVWKA